MSGKKTRNKWHYIGDDAKDQSLVTKLAHTAHIKFQGGKEHNKIYAYLTENLETSVTIYDIEPMLSYHHTSQNQSDNVGNAQTTQQYGGKKYYHQYDKEHPCGVCYQSQRHSCYCQYMMHFSI